MSSTEAKIREMVKANLAVDGEPLSAELDLDSSLRDYGVSSLDMVAFGELVAREVGATITTEDCAELTSLRSLIDFLGN